jgi:2-polyprenyl-6-methoxyphenol hydroxylase-like FAD-dependent oxidoreductase
MQTQVLIVGAGPVGLTMACELARYGVSVRIVDKSAQRTDKSKALVLWSRTLELLNRGGDSETFVHAGLKVDAANIVAGKKLIGRVSLAGVASPYPFALMLPQSETERLLEDRLNRLGIEVSRQVELAGFTDSGAGVHSVLRTADGREQAIETEWLVGCDGAHSTVRHILGLSFLGETLQSNWILADVHLKGAPYPISEIATFWHQDGVLVLFPIREGRYRVIADVGRADGTRPSDPTLEEVQDIIDRRGPGEIVVSDPIWLSAFQINERKVSDYRKGRAFVAGDAAHIHSPAGGQGMNTGMQDAFNLAWKLALVCRKACTGNKLLDSYSQERSEVGDEVLANAGHLTAVAVLKNHAVQAVRNLAAGLLFGLAPVRNKMADTLSEISIGYPHSFLNGARSPHLSGPAPGERVAPESGKVVGGVANPFFTLCARPSEAATRLLRDHPNLLDPTLRPALAEEGLWLVRPDGYAACVVQEADVDGMANYLSALES